MTSRYPERRDPSAQARRRSSGVDKYERRWWTLVVLSVALLVIIIDDTIINVAVPTLQRELNASAGSLQWMVDAYILAFAGLLLAMGVLGDRFGRKRFLLVGLLVFAGASVYGAYAASATQVIVARALMGIGGAMIMPSTLSVIVDVFPRDERVKAIGIWTAIASLGIPLGPIVGGWLLEQFWWGSIFLLNVPIAVLALAGAWVLVPESRHPAPRRLDLPGLGLSVGSLTLLVYAIIESPASGWTSGGVIVPLALAIVSGGAFIAYERRTDTPMLDLRLFNNARLTWGTVAMTLAGFALTGLAFNLTQYLQIVQGYTPLGAGLRFLPLAIGFGVAGGLTQRLVARMGTGRTVAGGLAAVAVLLAAVSRVDGDTSYLLLGPALLLIGLGVGMAFVSATDAVMAAVPEANAGLGSAINDLSRQVGAALGIAVLGSVASATFASGIDGGLSQLGPDVVGLARQSATAAMLAAGAMGGPAADLLRQATMRAFVDGFSLALLVAAALTAAGAVLVWHRLPADDAPVSPDRVESRSEAAAATAAS
jgi:EmrB/QacA subfamily drug resistance transporter